MHVLNRFDTGGLENGVVNLINHMPQGAFRHMVVALTEVTDFRRRLQRDDVECVALHKPPGHGFRVYPRFWRLLRQRRPAVVHTRNFAALEMQLPAALARVPVRVHGEHGRDVSDLDGSNRRYQRVRRFYAPCVSRFVALSRDLQRYLEGPVGIAPARVAQIYNGVDTTRFTPAPQRTSIAGCPFADPALWLVGTVGRMQAVKDQTLLARAFVEALVREPSLRQHARLVMVGDGPLRAQAARILADGGASALAWLPGERADVPDVMRGLDCFVLPSLAEGISNTILEAMASGLPVIATDVGGNAELVLGGVMGGTSGTSAKAEAGATTGDIVPAGDAPALAAALVRMAKDRARGAAMGRAGRIEAERRFGMQPMVAAYGRLYDEQLAAAGFRR